MIYTKPYQLAPVTERDWHGQSRKQPQGMCLDKGYDYEEVHDIPHEFGFTAHIHPRGEEAKSIKREAGFKARRWVVNGRIRE